ncbi:hypothetical protein L1987_43357 [Smallanthus sonchifolius]|uniref:Uncharacterized protein n=1 Tax=Smallanthus sonchifolius TaxID=185202 RepID=A0ACB9GLI9_9ASTR|nr:hypothetical protein L1987_43357 [Smallanthus sonchifolius]
MEPMIMLGYGLAFHCFVGDFLVFLTLSAAHFATDFSGLSTVDSAADGFAGVAAFFAAEGFALDFALSEVDTLAAVGFALSAVDTLAADGFAFDFPLYEVDIFDAEGLTFVFPDFSRSVTILFTADGVNLDEQFAIWLKGLNLHLAAKWLVSPQMIQVMKAGAGSVVISATHKA